MKLSPDLSLHEMGKGKFHFPPLKKRTKGEVPRESLCLLFDTLV
jgi:hypothetical protein